MQLRPEVRPAKNPDPQCVHHDPASPWAVLVIVIVSIVFTVMIGYMTGKMDGYSNAVDQGYCR